MFGSEKESVMSENTKLLSTSGLGLATVRTIAERHRAGVLREDASLGGLRARVEFSQKTPP